MSTTNVNKMNKLVLAFFVENTDADNFEELWMDTNVQKQVKTLCVSKKSGGGRKKDPNAPKRGKSAYLFFCQTNRNTVKTDLGEASKATEVTAELGKRWNILKDSKKASDKKTLAGFVAEAAEAKIEYEAAKAEYVPQEEEDDKPKRRGGKKKSAKKGPKRPKSAYLFFCAEHRAGVKDGNPNFKATEVTSELGRLWNELKADEDRADELTGFSDLAAEAKAEYLVAKEATEDEPKAPTKPKKAPAKSKKAPAKKAAPKAKKGAKKAPKKAPKKVKPVPEPEDEEEIEEEEIEEEEIEEEAPAPVKKSSKGKSKPSAKKSTGKKVNGYHLFCGEKRAELKEKFPKAKATDITRITNS